VAVRAREGATRKIRELGSLPSAELDKHRDLSTEVLTAGVVSASNALKRFGSVNKKALDQFVNFSEQRQALVKRQSEAAQAHDKIRELIAHLDREKDEAILLTFKQVSRHFREIFVELVPSGVAELKLVKVRRGGSGRALLACELTHAQAQDSDESKLDASVLDEFVGVSPRVSFTGAKETVPMQQLSGGQKALVALTLIFAIQRCDPAPFYLFDEIDQALDSNHRASVADLIQRQTRSKTRAAQFITTTFRPEMVQVADKCFGIKFAHKVSTVGSIDKAQALRFVRKIAEDVAKHGVEPEPQQQQEEEEAVAAKTTKRTRR
jgi:structural maintenance of chromosome 3 (chondroitin sulfate proteoglycan 6)